MAESAEGEKLERLIRIGFVRAGSWVLQGDAVKGIACELDAHAKAKNVLYAFVVDREVTYIGKTVNALRTRMSGYRSPGPSQVTNIRNRKLMLGVLSEGRQVEIYVLPDNGLLHYGGFHLNLAAALEDSLVRELAPSWNGGKKESVSQSLVSTLPDSG